jgi:hypothetical protein
MNEENKQENCCTPIGQIKRYVDCKGCDKKPEIKKEIVESMEKKIIDYIDDIWDELYHMEDILDGTYSIGMFGDSIPEIDKAHEEALKALRNYIKVCEKLNPKE